MDGSSKNADVGVGSFSWVKQEEIDDVKPTISVVWKPAIVAENLSACVHNGLLLKTEQNTHTGSGQCWTIGQRCDTDTSQQEEEETGIGLRKRLKSVDGESEQLLNGEFVCAPKKSEISTYPDDVFNTSLPGTVKDPLGKCSMDEDVMEGISAGAGAGAGANADAIASPSLLADQEALLNRGIGGAGTSPTSSISNMQLGFGRVDGLQCMETTEIPAVEDDAKWEVGGGNDKNGSAINEEQRSSGCSQNISTAIDSKQDADFSMLELDEARRDIVARAHERRTGFGIRQDLHLLASGNYVRPFRQLQAAIALDVRGALADLLDMPVVSGPESLPLASDHGVDPPGNSVTQSQSAEKYEPDALSAQSLMCPAITYYSQSDAVAISLSNSNLDQEKPDVSELRSSGMNDCKIEKQQIARLSVLRRSASEGGNSGKQQRASLSAEVARVGSIPQCVAVDDCSIPRKAMTGRATTEADVARFDLCNLSLEKKGSSNLAAISFVDKFDLKGLGIAFMIDSANAQNNVAGRNVCVQEIVSKEESLEEERKLHHGTKRERIEEPEAIGNVKREKMTKLIREGECGVHNNEVMPDIQKQNESKILPFSQAFHPGMGACTDALKSLLASGTTARMESLFGSAISTRYKALPFKIGLSEQPQELQVQLPAIGKLVKRGDNNSELGETDVKISKLVSGRHRWTTGSDADQSSANQRGLMVDNNKPYNSQKLLGLFTDTNPQTGLIDAVESGIGDHAKEERYRDPTKDIDAMGHSGQQEENIEEASKQAIDGTTKNVNTCLLEHQDSQFAFTRISDQNCSRNLRSESSPGNMWISRFSRKGLSVILNSKKEQQLMRDLSTSKEECNHFGEIKSSAEKDAYQSIPSKRSVVSNIPCSQQTEKANMNSFTYVISRSSMPEVQNLVSLNLGKTSGQAVSSGRVIHSHALYSGEIILGSLSAGEDGSGGQLHGQGLPEFMAAMASVKDWLNKSSKYMENTSEEGLYNGSLSCSFCGLSGHSLAQCSETLDFELHDLERRVGICDTLREKTGEAHCPRCLTMGHWGAECSLRVLEASAKAEEQEQRIRKEGSVKCTCKGGLEKEKFNNSIRHLEGKFYPVEKSISSFQNAKRIKECCKQGCFMGEFSEVVWSFKSAVKVSQPKYRIADVVRQKGLGNIVPASICSDNSGECLGVKDFCVQHGNGEIAIGKNKEPSADVDNLGFRFDGRASGSMIFTENRSKDYSAALATPNADSEHKSNGGVAMIPKGMLMIIESIRLSRVDLFKFVDAKDFSSRLEGFFLRLRFGKWEEELGGTGYRMALIKGAIQKVCSGNRRVSVLVDLGDMECTVDSQYISNGAFTEAELAEWWQSMWLTGHLVPDESKLRIKLKERREWPM